MKDETMLIYYSTYVFYVAVTAMIVMLGIALGFAFATMFIGACAGLLAGKEGILLVQDGANTIIYYVPKLYLGWASILIAYFLVRYKLKEIQERKVHEFNN